MIQTDPANTEFILYVSSNRSSAVQKFNQHLMEVHNDEGLKLIRVSLRDMVFTYCKDGKYYTWKYFVTDTADKFTQLNGMTLSEVYLDEACTFTKEQVSKVLSRVRL